MYNPPAFPVNEVYTSRDGDVTSETTKGMTLLDYFAAKALPALIFQDRVPTQNSRMSRQEYCVVLAYEYAVLMLAEREKLSK